jgi:putative transcriptional regulator
MSVQCKLSDFLRSRNESQIEFAERVGLSRQTIQKLYNNQMSGIEFTTLEKICRGLGINIGELLVMEETKLEQYLKHSKEIAIVLGANVFRRSAMSHHLAYGIAPHDVEAASNISEKMSQFTSPGCLIRKYWFPARYEWSREHGQRWQKREGLIWQEQAETLMKSIQGIIFIVGDEHVNGLSYYCLDKILDVGYDPRGKTRRPKRMELPYRMVYRRPSEIQPDQMQELMNLHREEDFPEGIWDVKNSKFLVEVTDRTTVDNSQPNDIITTGVIIYIDEPNFHHPHCLIIGISGFDPKADVLTTKHIFSEKHIQFIDIRLRQSEGISPPVFLVGKVEFSKLGSEDQLTLLS